MAEQELIDSVAEVCAVLSEGLDAVQTARRLGTVLSDAYGVLRVARPGWSEVKVRRRSQGETVNDVVLVAGEKLSLAALEKRFGPSEDAGQPAPFQPPRVRFHVRFEDRELETKMLASLSRDQMLKRDGYVLELMLIPQTKG